MIVACEPGLYGQRCESSCGDCLEGTVCSPENGFCPNGCNKPGFYNTGLYNQECKHYGKYDCEINKTNEGGTFNYRKTDVK